MTHDIGEVVKTGVLVLSLGLDTLAVAVGLGISGIGRTHRLRVGGVFALFEGAMPLAGFLLGQLVNDALGGVASLIGIAVLFGVGAWMIYESVVQEDRHLNVSSVRTLILTALSISLDEVAIGFSMGTLGISVLSAIVLIAAQSFLLTLVGTALGNRIGERLAERAELAAGVVLACLAAVLLVERIHGS